MMGEIPPIIKLRFILLIKIPFFKLIYFYF